MLAGMARAIQLCAATGTTPKPRPQTATSAMVSGRAPVTAASSSALQAISRPEPISVARRCARTVTPAVKLPAAPARPNPSSTSVIAPAPRPARACSSGPM